MDDTALGLWRDSVQEKRAGLEEAFTKSFGKSPKIRINQLIDLSDYKQFQLSLKQITDDYESRTGSLALRNKIYPRLNHVQKLSQALGAVTQAQAIATSLFGAFLVVVHVSG
jgi:hypothetical protein